VISELQKGNLKARFPTDQTDELGLAMTRFNTMADEIERLVERIRSIEKSRMALLQDLTHDLRTPVASLKNLLATIEKKDGASDQAIRKELLALARKEVEYFERLVEDLLVLAQVSEPSYQSSRETVSVLELIEDEAGSVEIQGTAQEGSPDSKEKIVKIESKINSDECLVTGDAHLLRRLLRNALENAYSFAESKVTITVDAQKNELRLLIQDDGQGFSNEGLKDFGVRKVSRAIQKDQGNRLSVGLGSVIMKTVAELHRGKLAASNRVDASGKVIGAEVLITLPKRY
jgi:K+-sensing histidine kinase KdpD